MEAFLVAYLGNSTLCMYYSSICDFGAPCEAVDRANCKSFIIIAEPEMFVSLITVWETIDCCECRHTDVDTQCSPTGPWLDG